MSAAAGEIETFRARRVWDSRGRPTVEVELSTTAGGRGRAIAPSGASTGSGERAERRDGGERLGGFDVRDVVASANDRLPAALAGVPATFAAVDAVLERLDPDRAAPVFGGNVLIATSMAAAWAQADEAQMPLWAVLAGEDRPWLPVPQIQIIGGGAHAQRSLDLQDLMVVPLGASTFAEAIEWTNEVYLAVGRRLAPRGAHGVADEGGFWPVFTSNHDALEVLANGIADVGLPDGDLAISVDVAATQLCPDPLAGRYRLGLEDRTLDRDAMIQQVVDWCGEYPIATIEDPLHEGDVEGHRAIRAAVSPATLVVGDDLFVTDPARIGDADGAADVLLLKPNQAGTLTETAAALAAARAAGLAVIASARSGETEDVTIAHVAVGWATDGVKVGSVTRGERTAKWNELIRIEEIVGDFAGRRAFPARA